MALKWYRFEARGKFPDGVRMKCSGHVSLEGESWAQAFDKALVAIKDSFPTVAVPSDQLRMTRLKNKPRK